MLSFRKIPASGAVVRRIRGFTLVEMMIVLVILGVILTVALPGFRNLTLAIRLSNYANEMVAAVYLARAEAIKRNVNVTLCATADSVACSTSGGWAQGWIIMDPNDVVIQEQPALESGFSLVETGSGAHALTFDSSGYVNAASTFKLCRQVPSVGHQERQIALTASGRASVTRTDLGVCP